jgi:hypothetical protein
VRSKLLTASRFLGWTTVPPRAFSIQCVGLRGAIKPGRFHCREAIFGQPIRLCGQSLRPTTLKPPPPDRRIGRAGGADGDAGRGTAAHPQRTVIIAVRPTPPTRSRRMTWSGRPDVVDLPDEPDGNLTPMRHCGPDVAGHRVSGADLWENGSAFLGLMPKGPWHGFLNSIFFTTTAPGILGPGPGIDFVGEVCQTKVRGSLIGGAWRATWSSGVMAAVDWMENLGTGAWETNRNPQSSSHVALYSSRPPSRGQLPF